MPQTSSRSSPVKPLGESSGNSMFSAQLQVKGQPKECMHNNELIDAAGHSNSASNQDTGDIASGRRTRSSRYLKSLLERDKTKTKDGDKADAKHHRRSKSSHTTYSIFPRPSSSRVVEDMEQNVGANKENEEPARTPIWAQFTTTGLQETLSTTKVPLNDQYDTNDVKAGYAPNDSDLPKQVTRSPEKLSHLPRKPQLKNRPKSECLTGSSSQASLLDTLSNLRRPKHAVEDSAAKMEQNFYHKPDATARDTDEVTVNKRGSRVMAAVTAFNNRGKQAKDDIDENPHPLSSDPKAIDSAFESLLDARNVPQNTREKMRSLETSIKADLVRQDKTSSGSVSSAKDLAKKSSNDAFRHQSKTGVEAPVPYNGKQSFSQEEDTPRKARPRSRTFTFSKGEGSPTKKHKSDKQRSRSRPRSGELAQSSSSRSLCGESNKGWVFGKSQVSTTLDDCISYLRKRQPPQDVEVGRLHKLRQLLRNETVELVDDFIANGGMTEIIDLLYRILLIEWREEHEDALLHEALSCLKALSTTTLALQKLTSLHASLFPALLGSLFSEEKKGPSDFTTRTIIVGLLSTYLSSVPSPDLTTRARTVLSYLQDPSKPEAKQPLGFIASMHVPRPYRVWQKEISDVTKEVFWIFLHNVNVIPYPEVGSEQAKASYRHRHMPKPHAPIPTAPYIGGVEWEATTYLTAHIDLLNGIIAALPTMYERNALRQELKDSGFEKVMGASLRTCKEKFYGSVHEALSTWVGAANEDEWEVKGVREGALPKTAPNSPRKNASPNKDSKQSAPQLEMPKLDIGECIGKHKAKEGFDGWF